MTARPDRPRLGRWIAAGGVLATALAASAGPASAQTPADQARRDARRILARDEYHPSHAPRPFAGALQWLGDRLRPVGDAVNWLIDNPVAGWLVVGLLVAGAVAAAALAVTRRDRRARRAVEHEVRQAGRDPDELERLAAAAESEGRLELALRLLFRAGLLRLDRAGVLPWRDDRTTGEVAAALASPAVDQLAMAFDEVVYGGRPPTVHDVELARTAWPAARQQAHG